MVMVAFQSTALHSQPFPRFTVFGEEFAAPSGAWGIANGEQSFSPTFSSPANVIVTSFRE